MNNNMYDSPNDITSVELSISAASGHNSPLIYANNKNQLTIQIIAKAIKEEKNREIILNFAKETWIDILSLRFATNNKKLNFNGHNGWSYTDKPNEYCREIQTSSFDPSLDDNDTLDESDSGSTIIHFYLYSNDINTHRIAVALDTTSGKHFTTADIAAGAERMSVAVKTIEPIRYNKGENLKIIYGEWQDTISNLLFVNQQHSIVWSKSYNSARFRYKKVSIVTENSYQIVSKTAATEYQCSGQRGWYESRYPQALLLDSSEPGGSLNSWYLEPPDDQIIGYKRGMNANLPHITPKSGWPSPCFTANRSGEFTTGDFLYWPIIERFDSRLQGYQRATTNEVTLYCYQIHIPHKKRSLYWSKYARPGSTSSPIGVEITDNYGNSGSFRIGFSNNAKINISPSY